MNFPVSNGPNAKGKTIPTYKENGIQKQSNFSQPGQISKY
jgi:hypothetical protein